MTSVLTGTKPDSPTLHVTEGTGWSSRTWVLLVVLAGALFLDGLDISMVGVALPSIGEDLHMSPSALQWIVSGYVLGYGGLLLLGGRSADLLGRRSVFLFAVGAFGIASVASAFLSNDLALIGLRFVKGVAAAFTVPAGLSIITTTFAEGPARNRALSIYTVCGASGFSMGLVFGGLLTELGWRMTFLLPGPAALLLLFAGLVLAALFVSVELRHDHPLVRLGILRSARVVHANLAGAVMFGAYVSFQFVVTLYLQNALGWSPLAMALGFLPAGILVVASVV